MGTLAAASSGATPLAWPRPSMTLPRSVMALKMSTRASEGLSLGLSTLAVEKVGMEGQAMRETPRKKTASQAAGPGRGCVCHGCGPKIGNGRPERDSVTRPRASTTRVRASAWACIAAA